MPFRSMLNPTPKARALMPGHASPDACWSRWVPAAEPEGLTLTVAQLEAMLAEARRREAGHEGA